MLRSRFVLVALMLILSAPASAAPQRQESPRVDPRLYDIHDAATIGTADQVRGLLRVNPGLVHRDGPDGEPDFTPLHAAVLAGRRDTAAVLIEYGAMIDFFAACGLGLTDLVAQSLENDESLVDAERGGMTALKWATWCGQPRVVDLLFDYDADISVRMASGESLLHLAAMQGHETLIAQFLDRGLLTTDRNPLGETPIHFAAAHGRVSAMALLIQSGGNATTKDYDSNTPLAFASRVGNIPMIDFLVASGADYAKDLGAAKLALTHGDVALDQRVYAQRKTLRFHIAVRVGDAPLVADFLRKDPGRATRADRDGRLPLDLAAESGHVDVVRLLLDLGARPTGSGLDTTILRAIAHGHDDVVAAIIEAAPGPLTLEERAALGETQRVINETQRASAAQRRDVLAAAARGGQVETIEALFDHDEIARSISGLDTLSSAAVEATRIGSVDVLNVVLAHASSVSRSVHRNVVDAVLETAPDVARADHGAVMARLIELGLDPRTTSAPTADEHVSLLQVAARHGSLAVAKVLVVEGADVNRRDGTMPPESPLRLAIRHGHPEVATLLRRLGGTE